jgi:hypothetical protein
MLVTFGFVFMKSVGHFDAQWIINKRCRWRIVHIAEHKDSCIFISFLIVIFSPLIVKQIQFWVFLAILGLKYRCLQNVFCGEPAARNWIGSHRWSVQRVSGSHTAIAWFIAFDLEYLWQFGFSFIQYIAFIRSVQNYAFTLNNDLLSHSSLSNIQSTGHVTSLNKALCQSVLGKEAEVESLAWDVD